MTSTTPRHDAAWLRSTGGRLSDRDSEDLLQRRPSAPPRLVRRLAPADVEALAAPPGTALARAAEERARRLPADLAGHGRRVHLLGGLLALRDGVRLDREAFWVAALLHDAGLEHPTVGRCFTVASVAAVEALDPVDAGAVGDAGAGEPPAERDRALALAADAVALHLDLGLDPAVDPEAAYVQAGSLLDLGGLRADELPEGAVAAALALAPAAGAPGSVVRRLEAEAAAVPRGRVAALNPLLLPLVRGGR